MCCVPQVVIDIAYGLHCFRLPSAMYSRRRGVKEAVVTVKEEKKTEREKRSQYATCYSSV